MSTADRAMASALRALELNGEAQELIEAARDTPWWFVSARARMVQQAELLLGQAQALTSESFALTAMTYYEAARERGR